MQGPNSFPSFQPERENSLAEELYPDIFADTFPPIAPGPLTYAELRATGKVPRRTSTSTARTGKRAVRTERSTDRVRSMPDNPAPLSLVGALQASITRKKPKKGQLVISVEKKRQRNTDRVFRVQSGPAWQLTPRLRLVILFVVIVLILLIALLFPLHLSMGREAYPSLQVVMDNERDGKFWMDTLSFIVGT